MIIPDKPSSEVFWVVSIDGRGTANHHITIIWHRLPVNAAVTQLSSISIDFPKNEALPKEWRTVFGPLSGSSAVNAQDNTYFNPEKWRYVLELEEISRTLSSQNSNELHIYFAQALTHISNSIKLISMYMSTRLCNSSGMRVCIILPGYGRGKERLQGVIARLRNKKGLYEARSTLYEIDLDQSKRTINFTRDLTTNWQPCNVVYWDNGIDIVASRIFWFIIGAVATFIVKVLVSIVTKLITDGLIR